MGLQSTLTQALRAVGQVIWPGWGPRVEAGGLHPVVRWALHLALLLLILLLLFLLNQYLEISGWIPGRFRILAKSWLPILFLLLYGMTWIAWWLWLLLPTPEGPEFPEIFDAWQQGVQALDRAGISLASTPLFLILGKPESGEAGLFTASHLQLQVRMVPQDPSRPIHLFANRDGIYVTCPDASLLSYYATKLLTGALPGNSKEEMDTLATLTPEAMAKLSLSPEALTNLVTALQTDRPLGPVERREARLLVRNQHRPHISFLRNAPDIQEQAARLDYLCRLIVKDRHPFPALNGILLLVPFAGLDRLEDTADTAGVCQEDLRIIARATRLICPRFVVLTDMETAPGFREFAQQFDSKERRRRLGQRFPLVPDLAALDGGKHPQHPHSTPLADRLKDLAVWLADVILPVWVYQRFHMEKPGAHEPTPPTQINARLLLLLGEMRKRKNLLAFVLSRSLGGVEGTCFGGCYLMSCGGPGIGFDQAFVPGIFHRLLEEQDFVSWTPEALVTDQKCERLANLVYSVLGAVVVIAMILILWALLSPQRR